MKFPRAFFSSCSRLSGGGLALALALVLPRPAAGAWPGDPTVNLPVCTALSEQSSPKMVSDGTGGYIVTWQDRRNGAYFDIYAQHILASGTLDPTWPTTDVVICNATLDQRSPAIASDGAGGAIVAWADGRVGNYAQHLLASGLVDPTWPVNGRRLCTKGGGSPITIISDAAGGYLLAWDDTRGGNMPIFAQHLLASGELDPAWSPDGLSLVSTYGDGQSDSKMLSDGGHGAIVAWRDGRGYDTTGVYAQHVLSSGEVDPAWPVNGRAVCVTGTPQAYAIASDGADGVIVTWEDRRGGTYSNLYAQHLLASGTRDPAWPADGLPICSTSTSQLHPSILADGVGGAVVTWEDLRSDTKGDIYAQRVLASGAVDPAWPTEGVALCTSGGAQSATTIVADGAGGAIVTWQDRRNGAYFDIYAQHLLASGGVDPLWPDNGRAICLAPYDQRACTTVADGAGGATIAWQDFRGGVFNDIYAQHVKANGWLNDGPPTPALVSLAAAEVSDGVVRLRWYVSLDEPVTLTIYRCTSAESWRPLGNVTPDGSGYVNYEDGTAEAGARYGYRLGLRTPGGAESFAGEAWVDIPITKTDLAVRVPNPVVGADVAVSFAAPGRSSVRVSLLDLAGRVVASRRVAGGSGRQTVVLARSSDLTPGVYLVRVELGRAVVARIAVLR